MAGVLTSERGLASRPESYFVFRLVDDSSPGVVAQGAPLLVGLLVTGCFVWWLRPVPPSAAFSWSGLASSATGHVLFASIMAAAAVVSIARLAPDKGKRNAGPLAFYTAACAVWLTPLAVLLSEASLWAVIPAAFLALGLVTTFRSYRNAPGRVPALELAEETGTPALFHVTSLRRAEEWRVASLSASILLQAALVTVLIDSPIGAAAFTLSGGAVLMWNSMGARASAESQSAFSRKAVARALGMTVLAIVLTAAGLLRYLAAESWPGQLDGPSDLVAMVRALFGPAPFDSEPDTSPAEAGDDDPGEKDRGDTALQVAVSDQSFPGIILLPDEQPFMKVVPVLPALKDGFHQGVDRDPLAIPFEGVYWYLLWPIARPPANAVVTRGSPRFGHSSDGFVAALDASAPQLRIAAGGELLPGHRSPPHECRPLSGHGFARTCPGQHDPAREPVAVVGEGSGQFSAPVGRRGRHSGRAGSARVSDAAQFEIAAV